MKKVHIGGVYYGCHNIGDEAILYSILDSFKEHSELSVSTYESQWVEEEFPEIQTHNITVRFQKKRFGIYTSPITHVFRDVFKIPTEIRFMKEKDVYICGGATILSDCPWYSLRTAQLAEKAGVPTYLWGVGMAGVNDLETIEYIKSVLNSSNVKKIYTRDELVRERLIDIGVIDEKIGVSYDPAIMLQGKELDIHKYLSTREIDIYNDDNMNIVVTISGEADVVNRTPVDVIVEALKRIQNNHKANVFLIPTGCGKHCKDLEIARIIAEKLDVTNTVVIDKEFAPNDLVAFLRNTQGIISSRLHMNIFGACAGVPSIGLVRNEKIIDFATLLNMPYLELETLSCDQLFDSFKDITENHEKYSNNIKNVVENMRQQQVASIEEIEKSIEYAIHNSKTDRE